MPHLLQDAGVEFDTADGLLHLRGTLSVCSADNPASYELGGFKNLTGALRKCRFCLATAEDMSSMVNMPNYVLVYNVFFLVLHLLLLILIVPMCIVHRRAISVTFEV